MPKKSTAHEEPCPDCGRPVRYYPHASRRCADCRGAVARALPGAPRPACGASDCGKPARKRGQCSTHYNQAHGYYFTSAAKDPERERARLRLKTHRRHDWLRLTDITPEYEQDLRRKAKVCPVCSVRLADAPYLPNSKELDHIVPQGAGGTHTMGNVRILCRDCNLKRPRDGSDYFGPVTLWAQMEAS